MTSLSDLFVKILTGYVVGNQHFLSADVALLIVDHKIGAMLPQIFK